eukprot:43635-Prymnesium_polylepis.1
MIDAMCTKLHPPPPPRAAAQACSRIGQPHAPPSSLRPGCGHASLVGAPGGRVRLAPRRPETLGLRGTLALRRMPVVEPDALRLLGRRAGPAAERLHAVEALEPVARRHGLQRQLGATRRGGCGRGHEQQVIDDAPLRRGLEHHEAM